MSATIAALAVVLTALAARQLAGRWAAARVRRRLAVGRGGATPAWTSVGAAAPHRLLQRVLARRRERQADTDLPLWIDATARAVRAGSSLPLALADAAAAVGASPLRPALDLAGKRLRDGSGIDDALAQLGPPEESEPRRLVVRALGLAAEAGGASAALLDGVSATLRDRLALQAEARALSSQARASAAVIAVAPVAFGAFGAASDPRVGGFLFGGPVGWACLAGGVALECAGAAWMARIVRGAGR